MASVKLWKRYKVPVGLYIHLNFVEGCTVVHVGLAEIMGILGPGAIVAPWLNPVATAIFIQREWIRAKVENSNGSGVRLRYNFALGAIDGIKRKGKGPSPCVNPPATVSNSSVDASQLTLANLDRILENLQILQWAGRNPTTSPDPTAALRRRFRRAFPHAGSLRQSVLLGELVRPVEPTRPIPGPIRPVPGPIRPRLQSEEES